MSTHLTPAEVVSVADGHGRDGLVRHVEACATCRAEVDAVRAVESDLRTNAGVPEPSPLFWDHFSARVRQATSGEPVPAVSWWPGGWAAVVAASAAVAVLAVTLSTRLPGSTPAVPSISEGARATVSTATPGTDEGRWDDVVQMAAQLSSDDVSALSVGAETASLVDDLTSEERQTLLRLLVVEMKDRQ